MEQNDHHARYRREDREEYSRSRVQAYVQMNSGSGQTRKAQSNQSVIRNAAKYDQPADALTDPAASSAQGGNRTQGINRHGKKRTALAQNMQREPKADQTIVAQGIYYPFNDYKKGINDNILVVGGSGVGKTRSIVRPNLLQATGSYIVSDPKGNLYDIYHSYLESKGYRVERLDLVNPLESTVQYNFFSYIRSQTDVLKIARMLGDQTPNGHGDRFWDLSAQVMVQCVLSYLVENRREEASLGRMIELLRGASRSGSRGDLLRNSEFDRQFEAYERQHANSPAVRFYESIAMNPVVTWNCIVTTVMSKYAAYDVEEIRDLLSKDTVHFDEIGRRKTALFVVVSDTDRSMDTIANVFFSQAMQELCRVADARPDSRLIIPVRFILDDFATNVHIDEFPRMISSIRSRAISTMLMVQAESQLWSGYGDDAETIISNCDTYVYLGGNDINTARRVGERCDKPMLSILNMPIGSCWVFRRGQEAISAEIFRLDPFEKSRIDRSYSAQIQNSRYTRIKWG